MVDLDITSARLIPYRVRLTEEVDSRRERPGRLVRLESGAGHVGWGDVAPLPGFSRDSVEKVDAAWGRYRIRAIRGGSGAEELEHLIGQFRDVGQPSLRFGLEQAAIGLAAKANGRHPADLLARGSDWRIQTAGLITGTGQLAVEHAAKLVQRGYRTLKIKVGKAEVDRDIETVLAVHSRVGTNITLRLDANRAWTLDQAVAFLSAASTVEPAFIEEPLADPRDLSKIHGQIDVSIALDETLLDIGPDQLDEWSFASHLVLKPTLLGGIMISEAFVRRGADLGMTPVVSAAYECGLGLSMAACLAARWTPAGPAAGLDTYSRLEADILTRKLMLGPLVSPSDLGFEPDPNLVNP